MYPLNAYTFTSHISSAWHSLTTTLKCKQIFVLAANAIQIRVTAEK